MTKQSIDRAFRKWKKQNNVSSKGHYKDCRWYGHHYIPLDVCYCSERYAFQAGFEASEKLRAQEKNHE